MPTLAQLQVELAHQQARDRIRSAHRQLDRLQAEADRLTALGWNRTEDQNRRLGATMTAIAEVRQRIADLEREQETERIFGLSPILDVAEEVRDRPGCPPSWYLDTPPRARTRRPARRPRRQS